MSEGLVAAKSDRLVSLDVFRGITIAGMVLVNNPGTWGKVWGPLGHASWHGWTPTDFIFPFFLYIVGVAMVFSFDKRMALGQSRVRLFEQVLRRAIILVLLGWILNSFPNFRLMSPFILIIVGLGFLYADEPILGFGTTPRAQRNKIIGWAVLAGSLLWLVLGTQAFKARTISFFGFVTFQESYSDFVIWLLCLAGLVLLVVALAALQVVLLRRRPEFGWLVALQLVVVSLVLVLIPAARPYSWAPLLAAGLGILRVEKGDTAPVFKSFIRYQREIGWALVIGAVLWLLATMVLALDQAGAAWVKLWASSEQNGGRILRIPGVLQRIGVAYLFASIIALMSKTWRARLAWLIGLLVAYWAIVRFIPAPGGYIPGSDGGRWEGASSAVAGSSLAGELHAWIDVKLLGPFLYTGRPDPEGILSTLGAIATVLTGVLTGMWLRREGPTKTQKSAAMFFAANVLVVAGLVWGYEMPINKKIWTSSYVVLMAGFGLHFLALCYYLIDDLGYKKWAKPFVIFGTNAIYVFFASGILARLMYMVTIGDKTVKDWLHVNVFVNWLGLGTAGGDGAMAATYLSSHAFALFYIILWLGLTWPLYRKGWFLKI